DPFLKERLFGLTNAEGNHGEDVKECWWHLDATPTCSWMRALYRYPHAAFPYQQLVAENGRRTRSEPEYELLDTGVFDEQRFFDLEVTYAKAAPFDVCIRLRITNHGPEAASLHVLPTLWFRNTWAWGLDPRRPLLRAAAPAPGRVSLVARHATLGTYRLIATGAPVALFTDNETNTELLFGVPNATSWVKDGINDHVVAGAASVNPDLQGTKAALWYQLPLAPGETATLCLRLTVEDAAAESLDLDTALGADFEATLAAREHEADLFHARLAPAGTSPEVRRVQRAALAGLLWTRKHYRYDVREWLAGDPAGPPPSAQRRAGRNGGWHHLYNADIISVPDEWEYPWYAAWDLAFHTIPLAFVDPEFAKEQLVLLCREWYMHPSGQLPAYEWNFSDVNPPVHAWAAWRVYKIDARNSGRPDREFLARVFHKLLLNFSWWVNRKDAAGSNIFEGGFLGLDNIGCFDRSAPLPAGARLEQSDATSWMAMYCLNMLAIALELAQADRSYEDVATKFFEHFLAIAYATTHFGTEGARLWDETDGFYYDVLHLDGQVLPLRVRSLVGLIPLLAVETIEPEVFHALPDFADRVRWFAKNRAELCANVFTADVPGEGQRRLLSLTTPVQLRRLLSRMLDEDEFLSPYGVRSLSAAHRDPVTIGVHGDTYQISYQPGESSTGMFGGNSNWRGPVWMPTNFLLIEALQKYHRYFGSAFRVDLPSGSGRPAALDAVADELSRRLIALFLQRDGRRPCNGGDPRLDADPLWCDLLTFHEYFHGDTGAGLGASHQTGWTALVAKLIRQMGGALDNWASLGPGGGFGSWVAQDGRIA
ncbi:MAG: MGH1-like glycoside hydrolase domain-containing protein, partial [Mycobacteriales bacterium]